MEIIVVIIFNIIIWILISTMAGFNKKGIRGITLPEPKYPAPNFSKSPRPGMNPLPKSERPRFPGKLKDAELIEYEIVQGSIDIPTSDEAYEDYRNCERKKVLQAISNANDEGLLKLQYKLIPDWLKTELTDRGYFIGTEVICADSIEKDERIFISWGDTSDK